MGVPVALFRFNVVLAVFLLLPVLLAILARWSFRRHAAAQTRRLPWLVAGNLIATLFLISLLLPMGEVYYRFFYDKPNGWAVGLVTERWYVRHYRTNNVGVRDNLDYALAAADGKRRLTFVGDSFTVGNGVSDVDERFVNLLRGELEEYEVHAVCQGGLDTGPLVQRLREWIARGYRVDDVVYVYVLNDITDISEEWLRSQQEVLEFDSGILGNSWFLDTWYYRLVSILDPSSTSYFDVVRNAYGDETWDHQADRLAGLKQLVEENGGRLWVVTFPFLETMSAPEFDRIHTQLDDYWREEGVPHLDLLPLFRELPIDELWVSRWDTHPNESAHRMAADSMREFLSVERP